MNYFITGIISAVISIATVFGLYNYWPVGSIISVQKDEGLLGVSLTTISGTDTLKNSRTTINDNFTALNDNKIESSTTTIPTLTTLENLVTANALTINSTQLGVASSTLFAEL